MQKTWHNRDKKLENTVNEILKSRARSRIYIFLLRKNGAKTEQIIKGTKLHPSTVRETLSKMYDQGLIYRKKQKNDSIGKNPFVYFAISPIKLLKKNAGELEDRLNRLASLATSGRRFQNFKPVKIKISDKAEEA